MDGVVGWSGVPSRPGPGSKVAPEEGKAEGGLVECASSLSSPASGSLPLQNHSNKCVVFKIQTSDVGILET